MARITTSGERGGEAGDYLVPTRDGAIFTRARIIAGRAPAVVCLHGLGDSHLAFEEAFATRYLAGASIVVPDMAGHGASPATGDYSMEAATRRVRALVSRRRRWSVTRVSSACTGCR